MLLYSVNSLLFPNIKFFPYIHLNTVINIQVFAKTGRQFIYYFNQLNIFMFCQL